MNEIDTALCEASRNGDLPEIRRLLDQGADLEWDEFGSGTPLIAAIEAGQEQAVELLINSGASTDAMGTDDFGRARNNTALLAARLGHLSILQTLLVGKANGHLDNVSVLDLAAQEGHFEVVHYLLKTQQFSKEPALSSAIVFAASKY